MLKKIFEKILEFIKIGFNIIRNYIKSNSKFNQFMKTNMLNMWYNLGLFLVENSKVILFYFQRFLEQSYDAKVVTGFKNVCRKLDQIMSRQIVVSAISLIIFGCIYFIHYFIMNNGLSSVNENVSLLIKSNADEITAIPQLNNMRYILDLTGKTQTCLVNYNNFIEKKELVSFSLGYLILEKHDVILDMRLFNKYLFILFERSQVSELSPLYIVNLGNILTLDIEHYKKLFFYSILKQEILLAKISTGLESLINSNNMLFSYLLYVMLLHILFGLYGIYKDYISKNFPKLIFDEQLLILFFIIIIILLFF